jgi:hypothetical protein
MTLLLRAQTTSEAKRWCGIVSFASALAFSVALAPPAQGGFIGDYAPGNFTLINLNANGFLVPSEDNHSIVLWGGNNGSGEPGRTDFVITAKGKGVVQFGWAYLSFDIPQYDRAGFLLETTFLQLADTDGMSGTESFRVSLGQTFGFRVATDDNLGEPGVLRILAFSAPSSAAVPEPCSWPTLLVIAAAAAAKRRLSRSGRGKGEWV